MIKGVPEKGGLKRRTIPQKALDTVTFPLRALTLFHRDAIGLSSLATERFDYVARHVKGFCLDIGCGPGNRFIKEFCGDNGVGIDVFPYDGLAPKNYRRRSNTPAFSRCDVRHSNFHSEPKPCT